MDSRHKNKAIIGVAIWVGAIPLALLAGMIHKKLTVDTPPGPDWFAGALMIALFVIQYAAYCWGGSHLAKAKGYSTALLLFGICWPAQLVIIPLLLFGLPDKCSNHSSHKRKRSHGESESQIARVVRYRRNALVAITLGFMGTLLALLLRFVDIGLFKSRDSAGITVLLVFLPSYAAIINGCWWWVRAKNWHEAVVFIGLVPVTILLIPYVRLIYLAVPLLLPASMVLMPIILIGVVAVLPDKSGMPKRKRWDRD